MPLGVSYIQLETREVKERELKKEIKKTHRNN
jgi:hypothetical protein